MTQFMKTGSKYLKWNKEHCYLLFTLEYVESVTADCQELSYNELDLVLGGQAVPSTNVATLSFTKDKD